MARRTFADSSVTKGRLSPASRVTQRLLRSPAGIPLRASARRHNLTISHSHRFVWYRVGKAGTRSMLTVLRESDATLDVEESRRVHDSHRLLHGYFRFGFVREPFERFESCWRDKVARKNQFGFEARHHATMAADIGAFVAYAETLDLENCGVHLRRQSSLLDIDRLDHLGRMETFDHDVRVVLGRLGLAPPDELPRRNASTRPAVAAAVPAAVRRRIENLYRADYDVFGYEPVP